MSGRSMVAGAVLLVFGGGLQAVAQRDSESARQERQNSYLTNWLEEDAAYIITDEERNAFKALSTDEERDQFIEQFWLRRDPTPDTQRNEYREEHYQRIAYANDHFASGIPGWRTDRGQIYITWGPPDEIESKPTGGAYFRSAAEGGGRTAVFPFERWRYRYIETIGQEVILEFVDSSMSNEYRLTWDPNEKDAWANVPGMGYTEAEAMCLDLSLCEHPDRLKGMREYARDMYQVRDQFDRLEVYHKIRVPVAPEFKDLEAIVTANLSFNQVPFRVQADFIRVTEDSILTPVTVQIRNSDVAFREVQGGHVGQLNIFGRVTSITGSVIDTFSDNVAIELLPGQFEAALSTYHVHQRALYLPPGSYKLDVVVEDLYSKDVGTISTSLPVPRFPENELGISSLILAQRIQELPERQVGTGPFVLGSLKVTPNINREFYRDGDLGYWVQVYNLGMDDAFKPSARIESVITRDGQEIDRIVETAEQLSGSAQQLTLHKTLPLSGYEPGDYTLQIRVIDNLSGGVTTRTADFSVRNRPAAD